jgi:hypothetical protein
MKTGVFVLAAALALSAPVAAQADTVPVQSLAPPFEAGNSTVVKTPDGVHFGTYADASAVGGSLGYHGLDGQPLSALTSFGYTFTYRERATLQAPRRTCGCSSTRTQRWTATGTATRPTTWTTM